MLENPDGLIKDLREGNRHKELQKAKQLFGQGVGIYRDPLKNIERLMRTEIIRANREAQWEMFQQNPYVVGFRVKRSGRRVKGKPLPCKLCDKLQGVYPKTFKFTTWHPHCECVMEPIFGATTDPEFSAKVNQAAARGTEAVKKLQNPEAITKLPPSILEMAAKARLSLRTPAGRVPALFLSENRAVLSAALKKVTLTKPNTADAPTTAKGANSTQPDASPSVATAAHQLSALQRAQERQADRTPEQAQQPTVTNRPPQGYFVESGGVLVHESRPPKEHQKNERQKYEKELSMSRVLARHGYKVQMLPEKPGISSPDILINGKLADLKKVNGHNNLVKRAKKGIEKQGAQIVVIEIGKIDSECIEEIKKLKKAGIHGFYYETGKPEEIVPF